MHPCWLLPLILQISKAIVVTIEVVLRKSFVPTLMSVMSMRARVLSSHLQRLNWSSLCGSSHRCVVNRNIHYENIKVDLLFVF